MARGGGREIIQAKLFSHFCSRVKFLFTPANPVHDYAGTVIVFHVFKTMFDGLPQVIRPGVSCP